MRDPLLRNLLLIQASYYVLTGLWSVLHISSFMLVTGPKTDLWLVRMVGLLTAVIGLTLLSACARERAYDVPVRLLSLGCAASLAAIDVFYLAAGMLRWVYLVDAILETFLVIAGLVRWIPAPPWPIGRGARLRTESPVGPTGVSRSPGPVDTSRQ